jgi:hypothetical protein
MDSPSPNPPPQTKHSTRAALAITAILLTAAAARWTGMPSELWFDEILSLRLVQPLKNINQVLWSLHTDNKHHLTWLWLWYLGPHHSEWLYRLPSFLAAVTVLPLMYRLAQKSMGSTVAWLTLVPLSFCYPLIMYSSEARGYSLAVLFAVAAFALAPGAFITKSLPIALAFSLCIILGFLSHLTFIYIYAGLLAWAATDILYRPRWFPLLYHIPAALLLLLFYKLDISKIQFAGGQPTTAADVLRSTTSLMFGTPIQGYPPIITALFVTTLAITGLIILARRHGLPLTTFFITALIIAPALLTATRQNPFLATRYYLVCIPFFLFLIAIALATISQNPICRWLVLLLTIWLVINAAFRTSQLAVLGRGQVRQCLTQMASQSHSSPITYSSQRPIMDQFNIDYYSETISPPTTFVEQTTPPPQWWILDLDNPFTQGPPTIYRNGRLYTLDSIYPSDIISGLTWDLYHLTN